MQTFVIEITGNDTVSKEDIKNALDTIDKGIAIEIKEQSIFSYQVIEELLSIFAYGALVLQGYTDLNNCEVDNCMAGTELNTCEGVLVIQHDTLHIGKLKVYTKYITIGGSC